MIDIENLSIDLGEFHLRDISLHIHDGEYMVLLGPTGAGKTVLVECIVGIHRPDTGRILIDGRDATRLYPEERNVGFVPQDYALFPNMTVADNVAYGLKARRLPKAEVAERVERMMRLLEVDHLRERLPLNLSGGEKQRVALGRALATEPRVLLLDEPLAALDENLRSELAAELRRVHQAVRGTFLHVCHSFEEAAEVADRVAIINEGRIVQVGTLEEIIARPASLFVARFTRARNILEGHAEPVDGGCRVQVGPGLFLESHAGSLSGPVAVAIRPEDIELSAEVVGRRANCFTATVASIRQCPTHLEVHLALPDDVSLVAYRGPGSGPSRVGATVEACVDPRRVKVFRQA